MYFSLEYQWGQYGIDVSALIWRIHTDWAF